MSIHIRDLDTAIIQTIDASAAQQNQSRQQYLHKYLTEAFGNQSNGAAKTAERLRAAIGGLEPSRFSLAKLARSCNHPDRSLIEQVLAGQTPLSFELSRQLHHATGIHEDWLYDGRLTPFYQSAMFQSCSDITAHIARQTLVSRWSQNITSLYFILSDQPKCPTVSVYGQAKTQPWHFDLLVRDVAFHNEVGSTGTEHLIQLILLTALLTSPDLQLLRQGYNAWGRIFNGHQYRDIINGNIHASIIKPSSANVSNWIDDIWDLQHTQRPYTSTYLDVFTFYKANLSFENISTNTALVTHIEQRLHRLKQNP